MLKNTSFQTKILRVTFVAPSAVENYSVFGLFDMVIRT